MGRIVFCLFRTRRLYASEKVRPAALPVRKKQIVIDSPRDIKAFSYHGNFKRQYFCANSYV
eukprot:scaffold67782_cov46-Attheya_sp.AAC.2